MKKVVFCLIFLLGFLGSFFVPLDLSQTQTQKWVFYDRNGEILYTEKSFFVPGDWENDFLKAALIVLEDKNFYEHSGVDFKALGRAFYQNVSTEGTVSGASTITMQLARILFLDDVERNYWYKIRQIYYALKLELQFSKSEILNLYLSRANFGHGAFGVPAASQKYFSKGPENLSLNESIALLATLQNPSKFNPLGNSDLTASRRSLLLRRLVDQGVLKTEEFDFWDGKGLILHPKISGEIRAPHFVFWVKAQIGPLPGEIIHVHTTLDISLYEKSLNILRRRLEKEGKEKNISSGAMVVLDRENKVLVMVGGPDFFDESIEGKVNMATSFRSSGSTLKPFLFAQAISEGISPLTSLNDRKQIFEGGYFPRNFMASQENGIVRFREALVNSYNIAAVDLLHRVGIASFYNFIEDFGINIPQSVDELGASVILGSGNIRLLDLVKAYSVFPHGGVLREPVFFSSIQDQDGKILRKSEKNSVRVLDQNTAEWVQHVLSDDEARWKNFSRGNSLELPFDSGAKTGTSQEFKDNWVIGFSNDYTVGVWVGNNNGGSMFSVSGMQGAGPIWQSLMGLLHPEKPSSFSYQGQRKLKFVCRRPGETDCSEKVKSFTLESEIIDESLVIPKENKIIYPALGDKFFRNSDLLIQLEGKGRLFFDGVALEGFIVDDLGLGWHKIVLKNSEDQIIDVVEFEVVSP